jgi:hypothetical protein
LGHHIDVEYKQTLLRAFNLKILKTHTQSLEKMALQSFMNIKCYKFNAPKWDPTHNLKMFERPPKKLAPKYNSNKFVFLSPNNITQKPPHSKKYFLFLLLFFILPHK